LDCAVGFAAKGFLSFIEFFAGYRGGSPIGYRAVYRLFSSVPFPEVLTPHPDVLAPPKSFLN
jgi:hypothetical protein